MTHETHDRRSLLKALLLLRALLAAPVVLAARVLSAAGPTAAPVRAAALQPSEEEIARQCLDAYWNRGDASLFRMHGLDPQTLRRDAFLEKHLGGASQIAGKGAVSYRTAFPDLKFDLLGTSRSGNVVTVRFNAQGTHRGNLGDLKSTGRRATVVGSWAVTFVDGKISTFNCTWDQAGLERQMS